MSILNIPDAVRRILGAVEQRQRGYICVTGVGLGTPKQQEFTAWAKNKVRQGWLLNVGFAFDVNAGRKRDAPRWMQSVGLTWSMVNLPASLPFIGLGILSFVGAWTGSVLAMAASEQEEDEFAPSKKGLNIAAVVGGIGAILCLLLPPLIGLIDPGARWSAAVASTALSFSAIAYLVLLLIAGGSIAVITKRSQAVKGAAS